MTLGSIKYAWTEIKNAKKFSLFFIFNLTLGMFGFLSLEFFKDSLETSLLSRSRSVLGADLAAQSRRPLTDQEIKIIESRLPKNHQKTEMIEIFSMVQKKGGRSTLVALRAIRPEYPFYGTIETAPQGLKAEDLNTSQKIWIYPELLSQLNVQPDDFLQIGKESFQISGTVTNDSSSGISTSMAPRIYLSYSQFLKTDLLKNGSLAWRISLYKLPSISKQELDALRDQIFQALPNADIQVYTHENASEQMGRLLKYLSDFLGLAALVALFISSLGIGFLCYTFLQSRIKNIAILICLGLSHTKAFSLHVVQILILSLTSSFTAGLLAFMFFPLFQKMSQKFVNFEIQFQFRGFYLFLTLAACTLGSLLVFLPLLLRIRKIKPALLLTEQSQYHLRWDFISLLGFLPMLLSFWLLSLWQMHSLKDGSLFFMGLVSAIAIFYGLGFGLIPLIRKLPPPRWLFFHWALRDLSRLRFSTISCFLALSISLLLLNLIPQIERSIREEIQSPESSKLPGLFLFDIQEEQVADLKNLLLKNNVELKDLSPLIRARLTSVNDQVFSKGLGSGRGTSRDEEQEMQFRNRGFNLSYRDRLSDSESITEGKNFSNITQEIAELSVEKGFADRLNLKMGDKLTFDIQGVSVTGQIINFRKVKWTSFQPNFFVLFNQGFLDGAPKTFLATLPKLSTVNKVAIQDKIVDQLPNVSMVDIARLVERLQDIIFHISWSLKIMLALTLLVGFSVLFSIASQQAQSRRWDIGLLKSLGGTQSTITMSLVSQFALIALSASILGFLLSLVLSYILSQFLFDNIWFFDWKTPTLLLITSVTATCLVTWLSISRSINTKAKDLL